jgi:hypothetical protein
VKTLPLTAALVLAAGLHVSTADDEQTPRTNRELSLAERAEAAKRNADAAAKNNDRKPSGRILDNDDLKKAKGNVIYLQAPVSPATPLVTSSSVLPAANPSVDVPVTRAPAASGDLLRELDENRGRAIRLRTSVEDAQKALSDAPAGEGRAALEERLRSMMSELLQTHEAIGVLLERMRQSDSKDR